MEFDSQSVLLSRISEPDSEVRSQILNALSQSRYRTKDISLIHRAVKEEVEQAAWINATQVDLGEADETVLLIAALNQFHEQIRNRVLLLLSFVFDGDLISARAGCADNGFIHTSLVCVGDHGCTTAC